VMAPTAVVALERQLSGTEIVRFPGPPYGIDRAYWENMIALGDWFEAEQDAVADVDAFEQLLRELHVIALMGRSLQSFYKPASPVADRTVAPGGWFDDPVRLERGGPVTVFLDGPRVNASLVGGWGYHAELCRSLGEADALADERAHDRRGLSWGEVVLARSQKDATAGPWFCPPRPIRPAHLEELRAALGSAIAAARADDADAARRRVAEFHQRFVQLHPFHCANQSLSMALVNAVLRRTEGVGIPHLLLDHLALRLSSEAYERLFARAVAAYALAEPDPGRRLATLQDRTQRSWVTIRKLSEAEDEAARRAVVDADVAAARWALLEP
jgi:hypothetical protein